MMMPIPPQFDSFVQWTFYCVVSGIMVYGVKILSHLKESIDALNIQVATIIERDAWHDRQIQDLKHEVSIIRSNRCSE